MAGNYSQISIVGPVSAEKGSTVEIEARITNTYYGAIWLTATKGRVNGTVMRFGAIHKIVAAGATESWYDSFIMPDADVLVAVESWYKGIDDKWHTDDRTTKGITLLAEQQVPSSEFGNLSVAVR